jgi:hypothetical protein
LNIKFTPKPYLPTLIASALLFIMVFLPWLTVSFKAFGYSYSDSANGMHEWGILTFIMSIVGVGLAFLDDKKYRSMGTLGAGVLALLGVIIFMATNLGSGIGVGAGLIIALIVSLALIGLAYMDYRNVPFSRITGRFIKPKASAPPPASPPPPPPAQTPPPASPPPPPAPPAQ